MSRLSTAVMAIAWALGLCGCQMAPTKVSETYAIDPKLLMRNAERPLVLDAKTIVIDARPAFEFSLARVPGSINLSWEEFARPRSDAPGLITPDLSSAGRRLALFGISPDSRVVVVGEGGKGKGEEGRLAWTLIYLGLKDVSVAAISAFRTGLQGETAPRPNVAFWRPQVRPSVLASREEVLEIATTPRAEGERPRGFLIDVRSRKEYFAKAGPGESYVFPELGAIHIPFPEFFDSEGRPNLAMREKLQAIGVGLNDRVILLSNNGVRSGAAAFALLSMGFTRAANYAGGWTEFMLKARGK